MRRVRDGQFLENEGDRAPLLLCRQICSSTCLIRGAVPNAPAQRIPSASRPTLAAAHCCCGLAATLLFDRRRSSFILRAHLLGRFPSAASHFAVFSLASVLATSRHQAPSTDECIIETVCKSYLCCFEYLPTDNVQNLKLNHTEIVRHCCYYYTNERIYLKINRSF